MAVATLARPAFSSEQLRSMLGQVVDERRVLVRPIDLIAYASDASFYRLIPKAVVQAASEKEVAGLFQFSHDHAIPITFRAAGTSLSGQAISDGLLVEIARNFRGHEVLENGRKIRVQPGLIGANANRALLPYGAKIGPDPASIGTCTLGGILSNNSSGMCCGVEQNAYHTLASVRFVLPSGTAIDTSASDAEDTFFAREPALASGILELKSRIESDSALAQRIRRKYRTKNTTGYSINAFLDFERAIDIFAHLLIGSEGTLAFISEAVLNTVPELPVKYTGLLLFPDLYAASESIVPLRQAGAKALEIMDRASLRSVEDQPGTAAGDQNSGGRCGRIAGRVSVGIGVRALATWKPWLPILLRNLSCWSRRQFTHAAAEQAALWKIRAGLFPSVGSVRKSGTTVIIEDVAFPIEHLAPAAQDLTGLFRRHEYDNAIIFGHAKDGNLHFVITQSFNDQRAIDQYSRFIDDLVELVVNRFDGALKAEHGTGRNMAPFVATEWGADAYEIMRRLKSLADPAGLLNPGVIVNDDARSHLRDLKRFPTVEPEIDKCIECGYCEPRCPSRDLTLTPRQRIVVRREIARQQEFGGSELLNNLDRDFPYMALDTCAVDGLCATTCPVSIDTGKLVKRFRALRNSPLAKRVAKFTVDHFARVESLVRLSLGAGHFAQRIIGLSGMQAITGALRKMIGPNMPALDRRNAASNKGGLPRTDRSVAQAVYFPACISRTMGRLPGEPSEMSLMQATVALAERAGVPVWIPEDVAGNCCGTPYSSKGLEESRDAMLNRAIENMWNWSGEGKLPIVMDTSPCTYGLVHAREFLSPKNQQRFDRLTIVDSIEFVHDKMLPKLKVNHPETSVALHPVCSVVKMGLTAKLEAIARKCSGEAFVPASSDAALLPEIAASCSPNSRLQRPPAKRLRSRPTSIRAITRAAAHARLA